MAAKAKTNTSVLFRARPKRKRPGVHAKTKQSKTKTSKNYQKRYVGQGH